MRQPEKVGTVSPSSDTGTTHVTLVAVPCCQLSISYVFRHCDLLVLKIIILWKAVCVTLYSQNQNTTLKNSKDFESSLMACEGLAALNTEWYPLRWWRGGENTPYNIKKRVKVSPRKIANWEPWYEPKRPSFHEHLFNYRCHLAEIKRLSSDLLSGLPMSHSLRVFDALEPIFTPFKSVLCVELTL